MRPTLARNPIVLLSMVAVVAVLLAAGCSKEEPAADTGPKYAFADDPAISALASFIAAHDLAQGGTAVAKDPTPGAVIDRARSNWKSSLPKPPQVKFDPERTYVWKIETNVGPLNVRLMPEVAPRHCSSYLYLTMLGFFEGLAFHRVIRGFMAQGGDPVGDGTGDPGYVLSLEVVPDLRQDRPFLVSAAHGGPDTDGSQFFVTFRPQQHLGNEYTIFGELDDEQSRATARKMDAVGNPDDGAPLSPLGIERATYEVR